MFPRKRTAQALAEGKKTRAALAEGAAALEALGEPQDEATRELVAQLLAGMELLAQAPSTRIRAARRVQGASRRRETGAALLLAACAEVRLRIKRRYRGPRHAELRRAFGEGVAASAAKPVLVLELADRILAAAPKHRAELREVRVLEQTLTRIERLAGALRDVASARAKLATARREVRASLIEIATVVEKLAALLRERAGGAP
jgi:hypothetical protein